MYSRLMDKIMFMESGMTSTNHSTQSCQLGSGELVMYNNNNNIVFCPKRVGVD